MTISSVALLVDDYQRALDFYVGVLGFEVIEDLDNGKGQRWLLIAPSSAQTTRIQLLLAEPQDRDLIGRQAGSSVFMIWQVSDFDQRYQSMLVAGVEFVEAPRSEVYGKVVVFKDCFGNKWDLIQPAS